ncbi:MAG: SUMF1/EgtB/PvdO family nonheme iron enzyme [Planctomycetota bacterium]
MQPPSPELKRAAEQAVVREALLQGFLAPEQVEAARARAQAEGAELLTLLRPDLAEPQLAALREVYLRALAAQAAPPAAPGAWGASPSPQAGAGWSQGPAASWGADTGGGWSQGPASAWGPEASAGPAPGTWTGAPAQGGALPDQGATIGPYCIERELARGGMGAVFLARHQELGRLVALKVTLPEAAQESESAERRFEIEAQAVARLSHPGIVGIHEFGEEQGRRYLAMDFVGGGSLEERLKREGPLPPRAAARLMADVARALHFAHERGVVHRDLKPANILLDEEGRPRVTDFGIAKRLTDLSRSEHLTRTGAVVGTPAYAAPEQLKADRQLDARADVYALGATLYALLTGGPPFEGETVVQIVTRALLHEPEPPARRRREVELDLSTICLRCLEKRPGDRYRDAEALAQDLERYLKGEPIQARPPSRAQRLRRWARRRPLLAGALATLPLLALALVGAALLRPERAQAAAAELRLTTGAEERTFEATFEVQGEVSGGWAEVWTVGGDPVRVGPGGKLRLPLRLRPGPNQFELRWRDARGEHDPRALRITRLEVPVWYRNRAPAERPPLPLPRGMTFGEDALTYRWERDGSQLVWVPPGARFTLMERKDTFDGSRGIGVRDEPHEVTLTKGYFIGRYEVTWGQLRRFSQATEFPLARDHIDWVLRPNPDNPFEQKWEDKPNAFRASDQDPGFYVGFVLALAYCDWAGLRLPTEAEWEHAARGPKNLAYPWGDEHTEAGWANTSADDGFPHLAPVGSFKRDRSPFGCFDMAGNVREWVADRWSQLTAAPQTDPRGPEGGDFALTRGGCWTYPPSTCRVLLRDRWEISAPFEPTIGFRIAHD